MKNTGVFCTAEERVGLQAMAESAAGPVLFVTGGTRIGSSWSDAHKAVYTCALEHGLPEITGYYGLTEEGEFVTV